MRNGIVITIANESWGTQVHENCRTSPHVTSCTCLVRSDMFRLLQFKITVTAHEEYFPTLLKVFGACHPFPIQVHFSEPLAEMPV
jgi:hypothetical protein